MCGITAFSRAVERSSLSGNCERFLKAALLAIENRGSDATGFAWTDGDYVLDDGKNHSWYWKKASPAHDVVFCAPFPRDPVVAIGHTRWATQGSKHKNENNHPVVDDGVMLVHNGVITNDKEIHRWLDPDYPPKAEVDTAAFAAMLAHPDELFASHPTDLLEMVGGSAAFAWIMTEEPNALHFARTLERPLTIGWTRLGDLIMSSTPTTLASLSEMAGVRIRKYRELEEGMYLKVVGGEIVEEKPFRPLRSYIYNGGKGAVTTSSGKGSTTASATATQRAGTDPKSTGAAVGEAGKVGGKDYYIADATGTYRFDEDGKREYLSTPVDNVRSTQFVGDVVDDDEFWDDYYKRHPDCTDHRFRNKKNEEFWQRLEDREDFWERVWGGEPIEDVIEEIEDEDADLAAEIAQAYLDGEFWDGTADPDPRVEAEVRKHILKHTRPQLTVIAGEKGKGHPYDYEAEKLVGKTEVDEEQLEYERYLKDMDEIDWVEQVPRRGWGNRITSAAVDVAKAMEASLTREER